MHFYYINYSELQGFFSLKKIVSLYRKNTISFTCEDIDDVTRTFAGDTKSKSNHLRIFLRQTSVIFGKVRKMFENVRMTFGQHLENLWNTSENDRKSSGNRQKLRY